MCCTSARPVVLHVNQCISHDIAIGIGIDKRTMMRISKVLGRAGAHSRWPWLRLQQLRFPLPVHIRYASSAEQSKYSHMFKDLGHQKTYSPRASADVLPTTESAFSRELSRLDRSSDCNQMLHLLMLSSRTTGLPIRHDHCRALLAACLRVRDAATASQFIMDDGAHASSPEVLRLALQVFSAAGASEHARNTVNILSQLGESVSSNDYNMLLHAVAATGNTDDLLAISRDMKQEGIPVSCAFYNMVLKSCVRNRDHVRAMSMFEDMKSKGIQPDKYTWGSLLQSLVAAKDVPGAATLLTRVMEEDPESLSTHQFNHIIKAYGDNGEDLEAYQWFDKLCSLRGKAASSSGRTTSLGPDVYSYGICLRIASLSGDKQRVIGLVADMYRAGLELNHATWRVATASFGKTLDANGLRQLIDVLISLGVKTSFVVWRDLIGVLSRSGYAEEAYDLLSVMEDDHGIPPNQSCYIRVVRAFCNSRALSTPGSRTDYVESSINGEERSDSTHASVNSFSSMIASYDSPSDLPSLGFAKVASGNETRYRRPLAEGSSRSSDYFNGDRFDWARGRDVIREMRQKGVSPTANIWGYVLMACAQSAPAPGESVVANLLNLMNEMFQSDNIFPRHSDWSHMVSLLNFDEASVSNFFDDDEDHFTPSKGKYKPLGSGKGKLEKEEILLIKLLHSFPEDTQEKFLEHATTSLCGNKQDGRGKAFYLLSQLNPYKKSHLSAWHILLQSYASKGQSFKCHKVLKSFEHATGMDAPISMWLRLVDSYAYQDSKFDRAFEVADELIAKYEQNFADFGDSYPEKDLLVPFFNRLLEISVLANNPANFSHYFELISAFNLQPSLATFKILASQYARSRRTAMFDECVDEMVGLILNGVREPEPFPVVMHNENKHFVEKIGTISIHESSKNKRSGLVPVISCDDASLATENMNELLVTERIRRTRLVNMYFPELLDVLIENKYWGLAEKIIPKLRGELSISCEQLCNRYMSNLASHGKIEDAVVYAESCIVNYGISALKDLSVWHALLQQAKEHSRPDEAQFAIEKMLFSLNIRPDVFCWNLLIQTYGEANQLDAAAKTLKDMLRYCDQSPPPSCWNVLFEAYKQRQDPEGCLSLIKDMYGDVEIRGGKSRASTAKGVFSMSKLFKDYIFREDFDDARSSEFIEERKGADPANEVVEPTLMHWYHTIHAFCLYRGGRSAYAELCRMREAYGVTPTVDCYSCVVDVLIANDEPDIIGEILRYMNEDGVTLKPETVEKMECMRRYDVILEAMDEIRLLQKDQ